jgi:hypothetical protein
MNRPLLKAGPFGPKPLNPQLDHEPGLVSEAPKVALVYPQSLCASLLVHDLLATRKSSSRRVDPLRQVLGTERFGYQAACCVSMLFCPSLTGNMSIGWPASSVTSMSQPNTLSGAHSSWPMMDEAMLFSPALGCIERGKSHTGLIGREVPPSPKVEVEMRHGSGFRRSCRLLVSTGGAIMPPRAAARWLRADQNRAKVGAHLGQDATRVPVFSAHQRRAIRHPRRVEVGRKKRAPRGRS